MARQRTPDLAKPVLGILYQNWETVAAIMPELQDYLGSIPRIGPNRAFEFTDYYAAEMGTELGKAYVAFDGLFHRERLVDFKHFCTELETKTSLTVEPGGRRTVNLDPGYLTAASFILSTFKDYSHRIYLGKSVFAEVTLIASKGQWHALPWTYPDYQQLDVQNFFWNARTVLLQQLDALRRKELTPPTCCNNLT